MGCSFTSSCVSLPACRYQEGVQLPGPSERQAGRTYDVHLCVGGSNVQIQKDVQTSERCILASPVVYSMSVQCHTWCYNNQSYVTVALLIMLAQRSQSLRCQSLGSSAASSAVPTAMCGESVPHEEITRHTEGQ